MKSLALLRPLALVPLILLCSTHPVQLDPRVLPLEPVADKLPAQFTMPIDHVFTSARDYRLMFRHDAPGVDWSREWVVLYSAGLMEAGHHEASVQQVRRMGDGHGLEILTWLVSDLCQAAPEPERPYALAKIPIPTDSLGVVLFMHEYLVTECAP